jgi:hypothetical protein
MAERILLILAIAAGALTAVAPTVAVGAPNQEARSTAQSSSTTGGGSFLVTVHDENGVAVPSARVLLSPPGGAASISRVTDYAGRAEFASLAAGTYGLVVQKEGFYQLSDNAVVVSPEASLEVTLHHLQEFKQAVHVVYSPPEIDPSRTAATQKLSAEEIIHLPYTTTRDIRTALPLMPDVLPDQNGQIHVDGAGSDQMEYTLDGFDVTQPVNALNEIRVSTDAVRSIDLERSRESTEYGDASGGVLNLGTGMGDDRFRYSATDFIPSPSTLRGFHIQNVTPRASLSGPLVRGRAWFFVAVDGEYDHNVFSELPPGQDTDYIGRISNLARLQVNLTPGNQLTGSFLVNSFREDHSGLSVVQPLSTTTRLDQPAYFASLKDEITRANGLLVQLGAGFVQFSATQTPLGSQPYIQLPGSAAGNYYLTSHDTARRYQGLINVFLPPTHWLGSHLLSFGTDLERITDAESAARQPFTIERADGTLERSVSFTGPPNFNENNFSLAGYIQDRWSLSNHLLLEPGFRLQGDDLLRRVLAAPRLAATYMLTSDGKTKLSAGGGIYYDRTNLDLFERSLQGQRQDVFYATDGVTPLGTVTTQFTANLAALEAPRFFNWSLGLERELPGKIFLDTEFVERHGQHGFDYQNLGAGITPSGIPSSGLFALENSRQDKYDGVTTTARHTFREGYTLMLSYTRSAARSSTLLDSSLDSPFFGPQLGGSLEWDAPNRIVSWGWLPLPCLHGWTFAYSLDWHDGYPYNLTNEEQELVGLPDRARFPRFYTLDVHLEKRFRLLGYELALRAGFNDVTGRGDPSAVNNNIDSPMFGQLGGFEHRAFTGRIRFLGRK